MLSLPQVLALFEQVGCTHVHAKRMAARHNSKGQIFLASGFDAFQQFPVVSIESKRGTSARTTKPVFRGSTNFWWYSDAGVPHRSPGTKLILYPQYANGRGETRLSGFKTGFCNPIGDRLDSAVEGRALVIGVAPGRRMYGYCASPDSELARALHVRPEGREFSEGKLVTFPLHGTLEDNERLLRGALAELAATGWHDARRLEPNGVTEVPLGVASTNAGGWTIEALLGIAANSRGGGDFLGWEIKSHTVAEGKRLLDSTAPTTLMDFSPDGGDAAELDRVEFFRSYGYANAKNPDRIDVYGAFGNVVSGLGKRGWAGQLVVDGFTPDDEGGGTVDDPSGAVRLVTSDDREVASWALGRLLAKWQEKHIRTVFVPRHERIDFERVVKQVQVGRSPIYCEGANVVRLLRAIIDGDVVVEPAMSWNVAAGVQRRQRWLFRSSMRSIRKLYGTAIS